ncbi:hypothetical protein [Nocardia cerradoensis]|nr:hypothetical protein [Nocardia cerradoensis]NKY43525.1 hypothetical protein [Nocardia cerradoensis]
MGNLTSPPTIPGDERDGIKLSDEKPARAHVRADRRLPMNWHLSSAAGG